MVVEEEEEGKVKVEKEDEEEVQEVVKFEVEVEKEGVLEDLVSEAPMPIGGGMLQAAAMNRQIGAGGAQTYSLRITEI